jgi:hypothetical protein
VEAAALSPRPRRTPSVASVQAAFDAVGVLTRNGNIDFLPKPLMCLFISFHCLASLVNLADKSNAQIWT